MTEAALSIRNLTAAARDSTSSTAEEKRKHRGCCWQRREVTPDDVPISQGEPQKNEQKENPDPQSTRLSV